MVDSSPSVMLLDGDADNTLAIARELSEDLDARIIGTGLTEYSRLLRSNYCDDGTVVPPPEDEMYGDALLDLVDIYQPDVVLPVGYQSTATVQRRRDDLPGSVAVGLPSEPALRAAEDKARTLEHGRRLGIDTPADYTATVESLAERGRRTDLEALSFPLFIKARRENGDATTARVETPEEFWSAYDRIRARAPDGEVLVQECIDGEVTYGCGLLVLDDEVELLYSHEELRSVPRHGGSGTRLRLLRDEHLETTSLRLLRELGWHGIALVEFKRRPDGEYVLMEVNPKFWASYALASRYGYRFASTLVARLLDIPIDGALGSRRQVGEMVYPLRELHHYARNRGTESFLDCLRNVAKPGAAWDVTAADLGACLTPPATVLQRLGR